MSLEEKHNSEEMQEVAEKQPTGIVFNPESQTELKGRIKDIISTIYDPEIPVNIYDLGLIYEINVLPLGAVHVLMTLTSPNCPAAASLPAEIEQKVKGLEGVNSFELELTFEPAWSMDLMTEEAKLELGMM